jgi:hypothetical protein
LRQLARNRTCTAPHSHHAATNLFGHKVEQEDKLAEIRAALTEVLARGNPPPSPAAASTRRTREPVAAK